MTDEKNVKRVQNFYKKKRRVYAYLEEEEAKKIESLGYTVAGFAREAIKEKLERCK